MSAAQFDAWLLTHERGATRLCQRSLAETDLDDGDVLIRVAYASLTRRDALACTGRCSLSRRLPCVPGSDLVGQVIASAAPRFQPGDWVFAAGYGLGVKHHGGYAQRALLPGGWLLPLHAGQTAQDAIILGISGLAVGMALAQLEDNRLKPERGPVLVTGASGNNGALAVAALAARGYEVHALTSRREKTMWLKALGASRVLYGDDLQLDAIQPLGRGLWAGAVDNLGGNVLAWIMAHCKPGAAAVALGDVAGRVCSLPLDPMVRRGVSLLGVDVVQAGFEEKWQVWSRLAADLHTDKLSMLCSVIGFEEVASAAEQLLRGATQGRMIVRIADSGGEKDGI